MHVEVPRHSGINGVQELPKLGRPMPLMKLRDELTGLHEGFRDESQFLSRSGFRAGPLARKPLILKTRRDVRVVEGARLEISLSVTL
jgi:hypothetical protein